MSDAVNQDRHNRKYCTPLKGCFVGSYQGTGFSHAVTFHSHPVFLSEHEGP
jgi:hypothetical protein